MARILKFNSDKAEELIARMKADIEEIDRHLANIVEYTVDWFRMLKENTVKASRVVRSYATSIRLTPLKW